MTVEQAERLKSLAEFVGEENSFRPDLTSVRANLRILVLTAKLKLRIRMASRLMAARRLPKNFEFSEYVRSAATTRKRQRMARAS